MRKKKGNFKAIVMLPPDTDQKTKDLMHKISIDIVKGLNKLKPQDDEN